MARSVTWLVDTNVWLALTLSHHHHHAAAAAWLEDVDERNTVIVCRAVQQRLLRPLTTAALFAPFADLDVVVPGR